MNSTTGTLHISKTCIFSQRYFSRCYNNPRLCHVRIPKPSLRNYTTNTQVQQPSRIRNLLLAPILATGVLLGYYYITDTRSSVHRWLAVPLIRTIYRDPEDAHVGGIQLLERLYRFGLHPRERGRPDDAGDLSVEVFKHTLTNPLGISSGLDKHGEIPTQLLALGPAVVEIGGVTPSRQDGSVPIVICISIILHDVIVLYRSLCKRSPWALGIGGKKLFESKMLSPRPTVGTLNLEYSESSVRER